MKKPRVSINDLWVASMWLQINEGAEDAPACARVSAWIDAEIKSREIKSAARQVAKASGAPLSIAVSRIKAMEGK